MMILKELVLDQALCSMRISALYLMSLLQLYFKLSLYKPLMFTHDFATFFSWPSFKDPPETSFVSVVSVYYQCPSKQHSNLVVCEQYYCLTCLSTDKTWFYFDILSTSLWVSSSTNYLLLLGLLLAFVILLAKQLLDDQILKMLIV